MGRESIWGVELAQRVRKKPGMTGSRATGKEECVSPRVNESAVGGT